MNLIYNKNKQGKIDFLSTIKRSYFPLIKCNPLSSSFYDTTLGLFGLDGYVLLI